MRSIITILLLTVSGALFAQIHEIKASDFTDIEIFGPFKVTLIKATTSRAEIDYRKVDPDDVSIQCSGGELEIRLNSHSIFDFKDDERNHRNNQYANVTIYYTSLERLDIKAGASLSSSETISARHLKITSRMGSEVTLNLAVKELDLDASMGSEVDLTGSADTFDVRAKMGTDIDASQLKCQDVSVSASMGASVKVFAEKELNASANFGASISCKGNPPHKHTSGFFGADVNE